MAIAFLTVPLCSYAQVLPLTTDFSQAEKNEHLSAGAASSNTRSKRAFLQPGNNLSFEDKLDFRIGESIFAKLWVFAPSSTQASDGLGPLHNARSCMGCHINGGRGHVPEGNWPKDNAISMLMRLSVPAKTEQQKALIASGKAAFIKEPTYGAQLQDFAMQGLAGEGRINVSYAEKKVSINSDQQVSLRVPTYTITDLSYGPLDPATMLSVRIANPMIGLGLLEAIESADLLALEDPLDSNNDGISGRANRVWQESSQSIVLGKFGWKAGNPTLEQQNSSAFATDMGLSTRLLKDAYQGDCTARQQACLDAPDGRSKHLSDLEVAPEMSATMGLFIRNIGVPIRKNIDDPQVLAGKAAFYNSGCAGCHQPKFKTSADAKPAQANQLIWPYSDLLLHDMGDGLADNRPEYQASGREWRTAPLWGLGATKKVSGKVELLHDGRARTILEAILWHAGEAKASRDRVAAMSDEERDQLILFLESL